MKVLYKLSSCRRKLAMIDRMSDAGCFYRIWNRSGLRVSYDLQRSPEASNQMRTLQEPERKPG